MFITLQKQFQERFEELSKKGQLFYIDIDRDMIWEHYLNGFPESTRQEFNCNCCKSFLRQYSGIVAIDSNNVVQSIWDITPDDEYKQAIKNVRDYVLSLPITNVFLPTQFHLGTEKSSDPKRNVVWNHFYLNSKKANLATVHVDALDSTLSTLRTNQQVLKRSLDELTLDAVDTILELIAQNSLYRGNEFKSVLEKFRTLKVQYQNIPVGLQHNFTWKQSVEEVGKAICRIRNTAIGTLLIDISNGEDLERAVSAFERIMAPSNYRRPTALVTPRMIEDAKAKIQELGYLESLERRFAIEGDLNVNNLLFIDKSSNMLDVFEDMKKDTAVNPKTLNKVEEITIKDFIDNVLPKAKALSVLLENSHLNNMVTLLTAVNSDSPSMFKWQNRFSWAYTGGITDSIKERVKQAGGKVDGVLRFSIQWNEDRRSICDLDAHAYEPNGEHIYFGNYRGTERTSMSGNLDVDMIRPSGIGIENITWSDLSKMKEGVYRFEVNNYDRGRNVGFTAEIEFDGQRFEFAYNKLLLGSITVAEVHYSKATGFKLVPRQVEVGVGSVVDKEKWNLKTNRFHKVKQLMLSPNCWEGDKGNKHFFFMLENCASDEKTRPFFNEFMKEELNSHRKFFETLAGKIQISPTTTQVAGIGFSETQRNHLYVKVDGSFSRILKVNF